MGLDSRKGEEITVSAVTKTLAHAEKRVVVCNGVNDRAHPGKVAERRGEVDESESVGTTINERRHVLPLRGIDGLRVRPAEGICADELEIEAVGITLWEVIGEIIGIADFAVCLDETLGELGIDKRPVRADAEYQLRLHRQGIEATDETREHVIELSAMNSVSLSGANGRDRVVA